MKSLKWVGILAVAAAAFWAGGWLLRRGGSPAAPSATASPAAGNRLFNSVLQTVRSYAVDTLDESTIYRLATSGMLAELADPYAALVRDRDTAELRTHLGAAPKQGVYLDRVDDIIAVVSVIPGSPGAAAGIRAGDAVLRVDRLVVGTQGPEEVARLLDGPAGSQVKVRLGRDHTDGPLWVTITRGPTPPFPEPVAARDAAGYYLRLFRVDPAAAGLVQAALDSAAAAGGKRGLILDLRGATEGTLEAAAAVAEVFLSPGQRIVATRGRTAADSTVLVDQRPPLHPDLPVVVLVDRGTAGAAEVIAAALQDHDRAAVVGEETFGRGVRYRFYSLGNGTALRLSAALWVTPSGRVIQRLRPPIVPEGSTDTVSARPKYRTEAGREVVGGGGIVPDRELASEREPGNQDLALAAARDLVARGGTRQGVIAALRPRA